MLPDAPWNLPVPPAAVPSWVRNEIDAFIHQRLVEKGVQPAREADRVTLIRRLSFDIIGLPPTPAEVRDFVDDDDPAASTKVVDRLLDSPHYGERWGRHWLDVARFGESDGFERNNARKNLWPYRDWVVRAFHQNLPFDQFTREQLAGGRC